MLILILFVAAQNAIKRCFDKNAKNIFFFKYSVDLKAVALVFKNVKKVSENTDINLVEGFKNIENFKKQLYEKLKQNVDKDTFLQIKDAFSYLKSRNYKCYFLIFLQSLHLNSYLTYKKKLMKNFLNYLNEIYIQFYEKRERIEKREKIEEREKIEKRKKIEERKNRYLKWLFPNCLDTEIFYKIDDVTANQIANTLSSDERFMKLFNLLKTTIENCNYETILSEYKHSHELRKAFIFFKSVIKFIVPCYDHWYRYRLYETFKLFMENQFLSLVTKFYFFNFSF